MIKNFIATKNKPNFPRHIYVDGSTPDNQKADSASGVGIVYCNTQDTVLGYRSEHLKDVTDNARAEVYALLVALMDSQKGDTILSDSEYCVKGFNEWVDGWHDKGWRRADKKPVANCDLWELIYAYKHVTDVCVVKVKAHSGIMGNELADSLAYEAAKGEVVGNAPLDLP